jgi:hypothetical protein
MSRPIDRETADGMGAASTISTCQVHNKYTSTVLLGAVSCIVCVIAQNSQI